MAKVKIIGSGLSGLIGSRILELFQDIYEFENLSLETGVDITDKKDVIKRIKQSDASIFLHLAAKTDVDGCEKDKDKDMKILRYKDIRKQKDEWRKEKTAWAVNVLGTKNIVEGCNQTGKKLLYISTDFVFDGEKQLEDGYTEEDIPNPINWYAKTKYEGEKIVQNLSNSWLIIRVAYPYRACFERNDFVRAIIDKLKSQGELQTVSDHIITPTFIDDIAKVIDFLIKNSQIGIFHAVGSQFLSPYEAALLISEAFKLNKSLIFKTTRVKYFKNRAPRPFKLILRNDKIQKLGIKMLSFKEGLEEIKRQINL